MIKARDLANIISGGFTASDIPNLDTSKITTGELANARVADLPTSKITTGTFADARISEASVTQHVTATDLTPVRQDITTLALKQAVNENKAAFNLPNTFIDQFEDDTGIGTETDGDRVSSGEFWATVYNTGIIFTNDSNTEYLNRFEASDLDTDSSSNNFSLSHTGAGLARSSTRKKVGTYSMFGNANTSHLRVNTTGSEMTLGTNDWTFECFFNLQDTTTHFGFVGTTYVGLALYYKSNGYLAHYISTNGSSWNTANSAQGSKSSWNANQWYHWAAVMNSGTYKTYIDGVEDYSVSASNIGGGAGGDLNIGTDIGTPSGSGSWGINGYMDSFRFSNNARYTSSFTPPSEDTFASATGTLIGIASVPSSAQTKVSGVMNYKDNSGTATLGTDLKIYFTCDGGSNWTEASSYTAVTPVFSTGVKMVKLGETTCTSGSDVRYKAVWANQASGSKETQLHGIGVNY